MVASLGELDGQEDRDDDSQSQGQARSEVSSDTEKCWQLLEQCEGNSDKTAECGEQVSGGFLDQAAVGRCGGYARFLLIRCFCGPWSTLLVVSSDFKHVVPEA